MNVVSSIQVLRGAAAFFFFFLLQATACPAQIVIDNSFGHSAALTGPDFAIPDTVGRIAGSNLFHSFEKFNVAEGESATFTGPLSITNIIGRVTGGDPSSIDGLIKSDIDGANLWLINPAGLIFGPHASLNVSGSLYLGAADNVQFTKGSPFSAVRPEASNLSVASPTAFGFLGPGSGGVRVDGAQFTLAAGSALLVAGHNVRVDNAVVAGSSASLALVGVNGVAEVGLGNLPGQLSIVGSASGPVLTSGASFGTVDGSLLHFNIVGGRVALDSDALQVASGGSASVVGSNVVLDQTGILGANVAVSITGSDLTLSGDSILGVGDSVNLVGSSSDVITAGVPWGSILITSGTRLGSTAFPLSSLSILGGQVSISGSRARVDNSVSPGAGLAIDVTSLDLVGSILTSIDGDISVRAANAVDFDSGVLSSFTVGGATSGGISVEANSVVLANSSSLKTSPIDHTRGGRILIAAQDTVSLSGQSNLFTSSSTEGAAGDVTVRSLTLSLTDGSTISTDSFGAGAAGSIDLDVRGFVTVARLSGISSDSTSDNQAGAISIRTGVLDVGSGATITGDTFGLGGGADIRIDASSTVTVAGEMPTQNLISESQITSSSAGAGPAGTVEISTSRLSILAGGQVSAATTVAGMGGDIRIHGDVTVDGVSSTGSPSSISTSTTGTGGSAGVIAISGATLAVLDGGQIVASTTSAGDGGDIGFTGGHVLISGIGSTGNASAISSSAAGSGDAGAVAISASLVDIVGGGLIAASTSNTGSGGSVVISSDRVNISGTDTRGNASAIATTSSGMSSDLGSAPGDAGSTTLAAGELRLTDGGSITTEADEASGGNIDLHVGKLIYLKDSSITTSVLGGSGNGGNITIDPKILLLDHSTIAANAIEGHGGNINIVADNFIQSPDSTITASSQLGLSGAIAISSPETDIVQRLVAIGATFVDPSQQLSASCASRSGSVESSLVSGWRGGLPADPGRLLLGGYLGDLPPRQGAAPSGAKSRKPALVAFSAQPLRFGCGGPAAP